MILEQVWGLPPHSVNDTFCSWEQKCPKGPKATFIFTSSKNVLKDFFSYHTHSHTSCVKIQIGLGQYKCKSLTKNSQIWAVNKHQMPLYCDLQRTAKHKEYWEQAGRVGRRHTHYHVKTRSISDLLGGCEGKLLNIRSPSDSERLLWHKGLRSQ